MKKTGLWVVAAVILLVALQFALNGTEPLSVAGIGIAALTLAAVALLWNTRERPSSSRALLALTATASFLMLLGAPPATATATSGCGTYQEPAGGACPNQDAITEACKDHADDCGIASATCDPDTLTIKCVYETKTE